MLSASLFSQTTRGCILAILLMCGSAFQLSCNGEDGPAGPPGKDGTSDKQIRLSFEGGLTTSDTLWMLSYPSQYITRFNPANYADVDSIIFGANIASQNSGSNCILELFNFTDSAVIANSTIVTNAGGPLTAWPWIYSANLLHSFPGKEITVGYRLRTSQQGSAAQVSAAVLLLYRK